MFFLFITYPTDDNDKSLLENVFYCYRKQMVSLAISILHNPEDAEDAVHDVFFRIAAKNMGALRRIKNDTDLRNYMLKATKNTSLNMLKKKKHISLDTVQEFDVDGIKELSDDTFLEAICDRADYTRAICAIKKLGEKYRDVLYCHFVMEMTVTEIATLFNQKTATVKKQLVRGKKMLLGMLENER